MAATTEGQQSPAKRFRLSSGNLASPTAADRPETIASVSRLGSCDMYNAGDSGFSELTSLASSEDENQTNDIPSTSFPVLGSSNEERACGNDNGENETPRSPGGGSDVSDISGLSDLSNHDWEPNSGTMSWVQRHMLLGTDPRSILTELVPDRDQIPQNLDDVTLWKIIINIMSEPPRRERLRHITTIHDVVRLLQTCKKILVLTGAGVSVSCGIPDFRSRDGIYARLAADFPDLPDPQAMFDIHYFRRDPRPFFKFARELWPGQFTPSKCHKFIRLLEKQNRLLRNYTQNIDTLEQQASIDRVIQCHGSFATATCLRCKYRVPCREIETEIMEQRIPRCPRCSDPSEDVSMENATDAAVGAKPIMKPDIVFFGEGMPDEFHTSMNRDKEECDLIIVIGSSLKVRPVALIPSALPAHVPQILINREPLRHMVFDVELLGDCDVIVNQLCHMLGPQWTEDVCYRSPLREISRLPSSSVASAPHPPHPFVPKKLQADVSRRDSGLSTGSSEPETAAGGDAENASGTADDGGTGVHETSMSGWWAPRVKANLADLLPDDSYFFANPGRYVFPGAEIFYDPDDADIRSDCIHFGDSDDSSSSSSSNSSGSSSDDEDSSGIDGDDSNVTAAAPAPTTPAATVVTFDSAETDRGVKRKTFGSDD